jgi:hypothetical protein
MQKLMTSLRQSVVDEAKTWIGTPFVHQQCRKGVGVDCCTILTAIYGRVCGLEIELPHYDVQWNLHDDNQSYLKAILQHCVEVSPFMNEDFVPEEMSYSARFLGPTLDWWDRKVPLPGDIGVWWFGRKWAHCTIVLEWPSVLNPMAAGLKRVTIEHAQTVGSISERFMRMRLMRPRCFL